MDKKVVQSPKYLLTAFFFLGVADYLLTAIGFKYGIKELNPLAEGIMQYGLFTGLMLKILILATAIMFFSRAHQNAPIPTAKKYVKGTLIVINILYVLVVVLNLSQILSC